MLLEAKRHLSTAKATLNLRSIQQTLIYNPPCSPHVKHKVTVVCGSWKIYFTCAEHYQSTLSTLLPNLQTCPWRQSCPAVEQAPVCQYPAATNRTHPHNQTACTGEQTLIAENRKRIHQVHVPVWSTSLCMWWWCLDWGADWAPPRWLPARSERRRRRRRQGEGPTRAWIF